MSLIGKLRPILYALWTLISLASALPILGMTVGAAAWNGVNFAVAAYLLLSSAGVIGLFSGFCAVFSKRIVFAWITSISAMAIACLSVVFALGFLFGRTRGVPLGDPLYIGSFRAPVLALYGVAFICCSQEAFFFFPRAIRPKAV